MCGICGSFAYRQSDTGDIAALRAMRDGMARRGPDGSGESASGDGRVWLGHRRLAIIDLSERGAQPMWSADGRIGVSYNGEVFIISSVALDGATGHYNFTAELHNNYSVIKEVPHPAATIDASHGSLVLVKTGIVVPTTVYWGDFTAGSIDVVDVHRGDGNARELAQHVPAGMWVGADGIFGGSAGKPASYNMRIASVMPGSPGAIMLTRPAQTTGRFPLLPIRITA